MGARGKKRRRADGSIAMGKAPPVAGDWHLDLNLSKIEAEFGDDPLIMEEVNRLRRDQQETH